MVVVAGRLTALSEDRNVLPTVAIEMTTTSSNGPGGGRAQEGKVTAGVMCQLRERFRILGLSETPVERHNSFSFDNRLIGKNYETIVRHGAFVE